MSRSAILLKVGLFNLTFFQLRNEGIHNSVTVPLGVERLREKIWVLLCAYATYQPKRQSSHHAAATVFTVFLLVFCTVIVMCADTF
jgi:hypothetical protein